MFCMNCGKEIPDSTAFCIHCGAAQSGGAAHPAPATLRQEAPAANNTMAIIGFVVSIISLLINFWGIVGIAATVLSVLGLMGCKQKNQKGKGLAIAGIVIGGISIIWGAISLLALASML